MAVITEIDYSLPISVLLKTETAAAHEEAEHSQGAGWLTRGELEKDEYIRFIMMLYHVYETLEQGLDRHASHPVLAPTYNPTLFARTPSLSADIATLLEVPESSWQSHPLHHQLISNPPAPFEAYVARLRKLGESQPEGLLAHAYVRYLGDLSGGQFIKRRIAKAYGLEDGDGLSFYDFKQLGGSASGTIGDMKKIKEWYRDGMDKGVGADQALKALVVDEAQAAFQLNTGLFTALRPPKVATTIAPTPAALGIPVTPTSDSPPGTPVPEAQAAPAESSYSMSSFAALLLAICLSQVFIVFGGVTSEKVFRALSSVFSA
ncbi:heme oxygenase [Phanerochaete sordida]|uniref:Heme oxygenase n=1 Tax=Phanerochaete sordida TaxID=48140 RepID=A0A9P3GQ98_9APHY|nr:heme oxygenase [Phanerochaete sordida]